MSDKGLSESSTKLVKKGDILIALYGATSGDISFAKIDGAINQAVLCVSPTINKYYFIYYFQAYIKKWLNKYLQGGQPNLSAKIIKQFNISYPKDNEETARVSSLLLLVDKKIELYSNKLNILKKYKKGIILRLIKTGFLASTIKDLVKVEKKTGLASSHGKEFGLYPFFINNDEGVAKYCDKYVFDGQHLILNTGGTASVKYYDGKFSAMSDCLILRPIAHAIGLYYFLLANEEIINIAGFQGTGLKHLDQKWFFNLKVRLPNLSDAELNKLNKLTEYQIQNLTKKAELMKSLKQYLLVNMFI